MRQFRSLALRGFHAQIFPAATLRLGVADWWEEGLLAHRPAAPKRIPSAKITWQNILLVLAALIVVGAISDGNPDAFLLDHLDPRIGRMKKADGENRTHNLSFTKAVLYR